MTNPEVGTRLSAAEAQAQGKVPHGHTWDEATQQPIPFGQALATRRLEEPLDLETRMEEYDRNRATVIKFVANRMRESEYDDRGYPIGGKMHDFYTVPGYAGKILTKLGAEHLGGLFRYVAGPMELLSDACERDFVEATVSIVILDNLGRVVGSAVSSCSTSEKGFQSMANRTKYGGRYKKENREVVWTTEPDYRGARNDVISKARKRAYVQGMIVATATDEIFDAVTDTEDETARSREERSSGLPTHMPSGDKEGEPLTRLKSSYLAKVRTWCIDQGKHLNLAEAIEQVLEDRRAAAEDDAPPDDDKPPPAAVSTSPAPASSASDSTEEKPTHGPKPGYVPFGEKKDTLKLVDCSPRHLHSISKWCRDKGKFLPWADECDRLLAAKARETQDQAAEEVDGESVSSADQLRAQRDNEIDELESFLTGAGIDPDGPSVEVQDARDRLKWLIQQRTADQVARP